MLGSIAWLLSTPIEEGSAVNHEDVFVCGFRTKPRRMFRVRRENGQVIWVDETRICPALEIRGQASVPAENPPLGKAVVMAKLVELNAKRAASGWTPISISVKEHLFICPGRLAMFLLDDAVIKQDATAITIAKAVEMSFKTSERVMPRKVAACPCCGLCMIVPEDEYNFFRGQDGDPMSLVVRCLCETSYVINRSSNPLQEKVDCVTFYTVHFTKQIIMKEGAIASSRSGPMHMPSAVARMKDLESKLVEDVPDVIMQLSPALFDAAQRLPMPVAQDILMCAKAAPMEEAAQAAKDATRAVAARMTSYMKNVNMIFHCVLCCQPQECEWGSPAPGRMTGVGEHLCTAGVGDHRSNHVYMDTHMMVLGDVVHHSITYVATPTVGVTANKVL